MCASAASNGSGATTLGMPRVSVAWMALLFLTFHVAGVTSIAAASTSATAPTAPAPRLGGTAGGIHTWADLLKHTNAYRARHGAPPLVWSTSLAASAAGWAQRCTFEHSKTAGAYGENLAMGFNNWKTAVDAWYNEVRAVA